MLYSGNLKNLAVFILIRGICFLNDNPQKSYLI